MDKNVDFNSFNFNGFPQFDLNADNDPMFNPIIQYEQAYMYYRYLSKQMEYKIKCKEYENLCNNRNNRKIE